MNSSRSVNFVIGVPEKRILSLAFQDSDYMGNQIVLNNLIATLVKYDNSGRLAPFLCESWEESREGLSWTFYFKKNFRDESGFEITPQVFEKDLYVTFREMRERKDDFWVKHLVGWKDFAAKKKETIEGIVATDGQLELHFASKVDLLLNYLRMPYFGYWGKNRKSSKAFISSGAYSMTQTNGERFSLKLRPEFKTDKNQVTFLNISQGPVSNDELESSWTIVLSRGAYAERFDKNYKISSLPADTLSVMVVNQKVGSYFSSKDQYKSFVRGLQHHLQKVKKSPFDLQVTNFYGQDMMSETSYTEDSTISLGPKRYLNVLVNSPAEQGQIDSPESVMLSYLKGLKIPFKVFYMSDVKTKKANESDMDLRFVKVATGQKFLRSVVEMMFCSTMGVRFPDPNRSICRLARSEDISEEKLQNEMNKIINDEGYIIPFMRSGMVITFSPKLKLVQYPAGTPYLRFQDLRLQND